jgi:lysozyme family protein
LGGFFVGRVMATDNFQQCLSFVLKYEGGKSDDMRDPGGRTMEGITQKTYDAYREKKGLPQQDVFLLPAIERDEIYHTEYWNAVKGDTLRPGEDLCVFDLAVNSGPHRALQIWNQSGASQTDLADVISKVCALRLSFLEELRTWQYFGAGWSKRVSACRTAALKMAASMSPQAPTTAPAAGAAGAILMGFGAVIHYLQNGPYGPVLAMVITGLILLVVCLFLSKPAAAVSPVPVLSPAEKLKDLLAQRDAIDAQIAEIETELKSSIEEMTGLLGKIHPQGEIIS